MKKSNKKISNLKADFRKTKLGNIFFKIFLTGLIIFILLFVIMFILTITIPDYENIYYIYMILSILACFIIGTVTGLYVGALKEYIEENK